MTIPEQPRDRLRQSFSSPADGVPALVDEILAVAAANSLHLTWVEGMSVIRLVQEREATPLTVAVPRSVIRAVLARIATLCNEHEPGQVSPHRGLGLLSAPQSATLPAGPTLLIAEFVNTPDKQSLSLAWQPPDLNRRIGELISSSVGSA